MPWMPGNVATSSFHKHFKGCSSQSVSPQQEEHLAWRRQAMQVRWALRANPAETTRRKNCIENCVVLVKLSDTAASSSALIRACMGPGSQHLVSSSHRGRTVLRRKPPLFTLHRDGTPRRATATAETTQAADRKDRKRMELSTLSAAATGRRGRHRNRRSGGGRKQQAGGRQAAPTARQAHAAAARQPAGLS